MGPRKFDVGQKVVLNFPAFGYLNLPRGSVGTVISCACDWFGNEWCYWVGFQAYCSVILPEHYFKAANWLEDAIDDASMEDTGEQDPTQNLGFPHNGLFFMLPDPAGPGGTFDKVLTALDNAYSQVESWNTNVKTLRMCKETFSAIDADLDEYITWHSVNGEKTGIGNLWGANMECDEKLPFMGIAIVPKKFRKKQ